MALGNRFRDVDSSSPIREVIDQIVALNTEIQRFWSESGGWAPIEAAHLLTKSRLDWQVSLSKTLRLWIEPLPEDEREARLILAWSNLGSLVEGTLKLYLSVWLTDYRRTAARNLQLGTPKDPDALRLEQLRVFINTNVNRGSWPWNSWVLFVQTRRNAIHAYQHREIGSFEEFEEAVRRYLEFLKEIESELPYT